MPKILGIDTGGTFTDGVILSLPDGRIAAKVKTPTTHEDLRACIRNCIEALPAGEREGIRLVCLSTTLATNALVEDHGCPVGLLLLGGRPEGKLPTETVRVLPGKMDIMGRVRESLSPAEAAEAVESLRGQVQAVAISGYASVRNPQHELLVKELVQERLSLPVACAHELTGSLGFYERTVTAVLNARLIPLICELIRAVELALAAVSCTAPLMIVRGDGTLMEARQARSRPIETILSGPAASIAGALYLTGLSDALVLDMGGTTTDIANVSGGMAKLRPEGASVGGWLTRVRAAEVYTVGLGGDSRIRPDGGGAYAIGPERAVPYCVAASRFPAFGRELQALAADPERRCSQFIQNEAEGYWKIADVPGADAEDQELLTLLEEGPLTHDSIARRTGIPDLYSRLDRLVRSGALARAAFTPTDLLHAEGLYSAWDTAASAAALRILALRLAIPEKDCASQIRAALTKKLTGACIRAGIFFDGKNPSQQDPLLQYITNQLLCDDAGSVLGVVPRLKKPVVAMGAPARAWTPCLQTSLQAQVLSPESAEVAGAIGAAVGKVLEQADILIRRDPVTKQFAVFAEEARTSFATLEDATAFARDAGRRQTVRRLPEGPVEVSFQIRDLTAPDASSEPVFVERHVLVRAAAASFPSGIS